jgi:hypothetical protein
MSHSRLVRTAAVSAVGIMSTFLSGTAASAAGADTTPPTTPLFGYAEGFYCLTLIVGVNRSTDDVTLPSELRYEVLDDGVGIGALADRGNESGAWGVLQLRHQGPNAVTVVAIDAAGNRSVPSRTVTVTGYYTPGCQPWTFG